MAKKTNIGATIGLDGEKEFRQAISSINSDMKVLGSEMKKVSAEFLDNNNSVEALSSKDEVLNKQLDKQKEKVDALRLALQNAQEQYGENDTKTDKWKISLNNAEAEMSKLTKEVKDNKEALEKAKNPANNLGNEIKDIGDKSETAGKHVLSMGDIIKANLISATIIDGVKSLASSITSLASDALDGADSIQQMADQTGMSAEKIQEWQFVGDTLGTSIDTITGAQAKLTKSMDNARNGSEKYETAFKTLGVSVTNADGSLRDANTVMTEAFDALGKVGNETDRNALAMQLFGKSAKDLNPLISAGSDQLKGLAEQARNTGAVMSNETVSSLDNFGDTIGQAKQSITAMAGAILSELMPSIEPMINKVQENAPAIVETVGAIASKVGELVGWLVDNGDTVIAVIGGIAAGMVAWNIATMIQGVVGAIKAFQLANEGASIAQYALNLAMSLNPIGIIIAAIAALVAGVVILWNTNEDFRNAVIGIFTSIKDGFMQAWDAIKTFVTETIPNVFKKFIGWIKDNWQGLLLLLVNPFAGAFKLVYDNCDVFRETVDKFVNKIKTLITTLFNNMVNGIKELPNKFAETGTKIVKSLWNAINDLVSWIGTKVGGFAGGVVKALSNGITGLADIGFNLVKGLWDGINNATDWIIDKIGGFTDSVVGSIKDFFGIHSPSTVFRDEVGKYLAQGLGEGFTSEMSGIAADMNKSIPKDFEVNGAYTVKSSFTNENRMILSALGDLYQAINNISGDVVLRIGNEDIARANKLGAMSLDRRYNSVIVGG